MGDDNLQNGAPEYCMIYQAWLEGEVQDEARASDSNSKEANGDNSSSEGSHVVTLNKLVSRDSDDGSSESACWWVNRDDAGESDANDEDWDDQVDGDSK